MVTTRVKYGIPDIELEWSCGGTVNPSCFAGHQLVVVFLPKEMEQRRLELEIYERLARELSGTDSWIVLIGDPTNLRSDGPVALDPQDEAWLAFKRVAQAEDLDRDEGAVFNFSRGGAFEHVRAGAGSAEEVRKDLLGRA